MKNKRWIAALAGGLLLAFGARTQAADPVNKTASGLAVRGYDIVGYFADGKPVKGKKVFQVQWNGAVWHFSNAEQRDQFEVNPEKYAPEFGGYCAWAVSQNSIVDADPHVWSIVDGKLYLNYNKEVQKTWKRNMEQFIVDGDRNWPEVLKQ